MSFLNFASGLAGGFADTRNAIRDREERNALREAMTQPMGVMGPAGGPPVTGSGATGGFGSPGGSSAGQIPVNPTLFDLTAATEGGNGADTLYGNAQRGGRFNGVDVSKMTLAQLADFASPSGDYGQWVAANNNGTVATPMGKHQIVGSTLRAAAAQMGLSPDTVFTGQTQDAIAAHLARNRLSGARTPAAKRAALRAEWAGFRNVSDQALDTAIANFEANGGNINPRPMGVGVQ